MSDVFVVFFMIRCLFPYACRGDSIEKFMNGQPGQCCPHLCRGDSSKFFMIG